MALHLGPQFTNPRIRIAAVARREDVLQDIAAFKAEGLIRHLYQVFPTLAQARAWVLRR